MSILTLPQITEACVKQGLKSKVIRKHRIALPTPIIAYQFIKIDLIVSLAHAWCGDITYCSTEEGWLYLATVIDLYSNKVIGYATSKNIDKWLVIKALSNVLQARNYPQGVIVHTDRGSQVRREVA